MSVSSDCIKLDLSQPAVMGILNYTPDSFSDGGSYFFAEKAVEHALKMQMDGASIIDVGGESTRPNASYVSVDEELERVIPIIQLLSQTLSIPISIDSYKPEVIAEAIRAGATFINDISALNNSDSLQIVAHAELPVCLMHMLGNPRTMQQNPHYENVVEAVYQFLEQRI